jgi:membrane-associated phospholipid phosphatase
MRLKQFDKFLLPAGAVIWVLAYYWLGPTLNRMQCHQDPAACQVEEIPRIDRPALGANFEIGHLVSDTTQTLSGVWAAVVPGVLQLARVSAGVVSPAAAWAAYGTDFVILLETAVWNGAFTFLVKTTVQRPRPYTYLNRSPFNRNLQAYLSFYSGHMSFASAMNTGVVLALASRRVSRRWLWALGAIGIALVVLTGIGRVVAGVHFITDVSLGAVAGVLVAYWIASIHK